MTTIAETSNVTTPRPVTRVITGQPTTEGGGVNLTRVLGQPALSELDPFLLLDEFRSDDSADYLAGFPEHPHRGFETVTYMLAGRMRHGDNHGHSGVIGPGGVQWMTAGRGIVHSEMPEQDEGLMWGFQLWVNLPAADKLGEPGYQEYAADAIPQVDLPDGGQVRVIAGHYRDAVGPVAAAATAPVYLDVRLNAGKTFTTAVPAGHNAMLYVYDGAVDVAGQSLTRGQLAQLGQAAGSEDGVAFTAGDDGGRALLIAGAPLNEPVARYGPFVMNHAHEIRQAALDFQAGRF